MNHVHATQLQNMLRDVYDLGAIVVEKRLLLRAYERSRFGKGIWTDLHQRWQDIIEEDERSWQLGLLDWGEKSPVLALVCLDPIDTPNEERCLRPLTELVPALAKPIPDNDEEEALPPSRAKRQRSP